MRIRYMPWLHDTEINAGSDPETNKTPFRQSPGLHGHNTPTNTQSEILYCANYGTCAIANACGPKQLTGRMASNMQVGHCGLERIRCTEATAHQFLIGTRSYHARTLLLRLRAASRPP